MKRRRVEYDYARDTFVGHRPSEVLPVIKEVFSTASVALLISSYKCIHLRYHQAIFLSIQVCVVIDCLR